MLALLLTAGLLLVTLVFAAQNPDTVAVRFVRWDLQVSKLVLMFGFLFTGAFVTSFINSLTEISARRIFREFALKITEMERLLAEKTTKIGELERQLHERPKRLTDTEGTSQAVSAPGDATLRDHGAPPPASTESPPSGGIPT